jgi:hypothetical protein
MLYWDLLCLNMVCWVAEVSNQMLELYEQNKSGTGSRLSDPTSSAGLNNQLRGLAPAQATTDVPPANGHCPLPATVKTQSEEVKAISTFVDVHATQGEFTEAQSSLEEGEDMAESKVDLVEMKSTDATVQTLVSVTKVEPGERRTTEAKMESVDDSKPAWGSLEEVNTDKVKAAMEKRRRSRGGTINAHPTFDKVEPSNEEVQSTDIECAANSHHHQCLNYTQASFTLFPASPLQFFCVMLLET